MDTSPTATAPPPPTVLNAAAKPPESEPETTFRIQPGKPLSFTNGVLKRHHQHHPLHRHQGGGAPPLPAGAATAVVSYKECLKNHAAAMGGHALDGCGEFMPSPNATPNDPTSLKCAACGCHRNFHRREPEEPLPPPTTSIQHVIEYQPHHRHHPPPPPPPRGGNSSPDSPSPPPISSSYYPSAPHMLLALSAGLSGNPQESNSPAAKTSMGMASGGSSAGVGATLNGRKRFRTKFTQNQKERMYEFAEKVGWKFQKRDEALISEFCTEVGVDRGVLKVWMHNNKNTLGKKDANDSNGNGFSIGIGSDNGNGFSRNSLENTTTAATADHQRHQHQHNYCDHHRENPNHHDNNNDSVSTAHAVATNGSCSSS